MELYGAHHPHHSAHEIHLPWYMILGTMLMLTAMIIFVCASPLDTTPLAQEPVPAAAQ